MRQMVPAETVNLPIVSVGGIPPIRAGGDQFGALYR